MQVYTKTHWGSLKTLFFFAFVLFLAYLPVSSFLFFLKNDAFTGYFPPKFFMSETIASGYLPLWNPYINFGFPQYGDMSGGYWSPVTWLVASTVGYDAYSFTAEVFLYILLSAIGMYKLTGLLGISGNMRIIAAISFMCCGYHVGHLQHFNWLSGSAFLPWCLWSYLMLVKVPSLKTVLISVLCFYLFISSAHPGIIIGAFYFFFFISIYNLRSLKKKKANTDFTKKWLLTHIAFLLLLILVSVGMIVGYADIIPHFVRGEKNSFLTGASDSSSLQSWISLLFPMATVKNEGWFMADLSLRDSYFGITLLWFLILSLFSKKNSFQKLLLLTAAFFFLLSIGGIFHSIAAKFLPLIGYVRLNGEFRIFSLLCLILSSVIEINKFFSEEKKIEGKLNGIYYLLTAIICSIIAWSVYKAGVTKESFLYQVTTITSGGSTVNSIKFFLDSISFYDCLWMQGIIQLLILRLVKKALKLKNSLLLVKVVAADMILATLLIVPFTGAGKASLKQVQQVLNLSPKGIPIPALQNISNNATLPTAQNELVGSWSMFSKQIGNSKEVPYPIQLKSMKALFNDVSKENELQYFNKPFLFIKNNPDSGEVKITSFTPNKLSCIVNTVENNNQLVLQQNNYPHWSCTVNGKEVNIIFDGASFMSIPLQKGNNEVIFSFNPANVKYAMLISLIAFIALTCSVLFLVIKTK